MNPRYILEKKHFYFKFFKIYVAGYHCHKVKMCDSLFCMTKDMHVCFIFDFGLVYGLSSNPLMIVLVSVSPIKAPKSKMTMTNLSLFWVIENALSSVKWLPKRNVKKTFIST